MLGAVLLDSLLAHLSPQSVRRIGRRLLHSRLPHHSRYQRFRAAELAQGAALLRRQVINGSMEWSCRSDVLRA